MRQGGVATERAHGRCRGVFIKRLSTLDARDGVYAAADYALSHSMASARRQGEASGGEHTVRWGGAPANGRMQVAGVSRYERGRLTANDLLPNSGAKLPDVISGLTVWHASGRRRG